MFSGQNQHLGDYRYNQEQQQRKATNVKASSSSNAPKPQTWTTGGYAPHSQPKPVKVYNFNTDGAAADRRAKVKYAEDVEELKKYVGDGPVSIWELCDGAMSALAGHDLVRAAVLSKYALSFQPEFAQKIQHALSFLLGEEKKICSFSPNYADQRKLTLEQIVDSFTKKRFDLKYLDVEYLDIYQRRCDKEEKYKSNDQKKFSKILNQLHSDGFNFNEDTLGLNHDFHLGVGDYGAIDNQDTEVGLSEKNIKADKRKLDKKLASFNQEFDAELKSLFNQSQTDSNARTIREIEQDGLALLKENQFDGAIMHAEILFIFGRHIEWARILHESVETLCCGINGSKAETLRNSYVMQFCKEILYQTSIDKDGSSQYRTGNKEIASVATQLINENQKNPYSIKTGAFSVKRVKDDTLDKYKFSDKFILLEYNRRTTMEEQGLSEVADGRLPSQRVGPYGKIFLGGDFEEAIKSYNSPGLKDVNLDNSLDLHHDLYSGYGTAGNQHAVDLAGYEGDTDY